MLEIGRGMLAALQLEVRSDITVLASSQPDMAIKFMEVRDKLNSFTTSMIEDSSTFANANTGIDSSKLISERHALFKQFDDLVQNIRTLEGFENFLQGPSISEVYSLAKDRAIVVFNVSNIRSDALLITTKKISSVYLPLLTLESLQNYVIKFFEAISVRNLLQYSDANRKMNAVLEWLWDVAVSPVLNELGFTKWPSNDGVWPRVCWVGSGLLNILPIHASGYHRDSSKNTALDHVISSYSPTVKSLAYARERDNQLTMHERAGQSLQDKAILVAMSTTPGQNDLNSV